MAREVRNAGVLERSLDVLQSQKPTEGNSKTRLDALIAQAKEKVQAHNQRRGVLEQAPPPAFPAVQVATVLPTRSGPTMCRAERAVDEAQAFTERQVKESENLTRRSREVYSFLHLFAAASALFKEQSLQAQQITVFLPGEALADALGLARSTLYDALRRLKEVGLVDYRGHKTTLARWGNRCDGSLYAVKFYPGRTGRAKLHFDDLSASYRDLEADIEAGRTWYRLGQSITGSRDIKRTLKALFGWLHSRDDFARGGQVERSPFMTVQASSSELILDILQGPKVERPRRIEAAVRAVVIALGDGGSLNLWRKLLRAMVRRADAGRNYSSALHAAVQRARVDREEGFARRAGALLIARLKRAGVYEELMAA